MAEVRRCGGAGRRRQQGTARRDSGKSDGPSHLSARGWQHKEPPGGRPVGESEWTRPEVGQAEGHGWRRRRMDWYYIAGRGAHGSQFIRASRTNCQPAKSSGMSGSGQSPRRHQLEEPSRRKWWPRPATHLSRRGTQPPLPCGPRAAGAQQRTSQQGRERPESWQNLLPRSESWRRRPDHRGTDP